MGVEVYSFEFEITPEDQKKQVFLKYLGMEVCYNVKEEFLAPICK